MIGETITLTVDSVAKVLNRINQDGYASEYLLREANGEYQMLVRNTRGSKPDSSGIVRDRHNVKVTRIIYGASGSPNITTVINFTVDNDVVSDDTDVINLSNAVTAWADGTIVGKLLGNES
uniref:Uncharacterized protein n=1 Tax=Beihai levi-like virus 5 TaxID=1922423 RepID=A0A1L3KI12_9VIRU|nr:hypothetical protein [Beihai levi-like virus 5]